MIKLKDLTHTFHKEMLNITGRLRKTKYLYHILKKGWLNYTGDVLEICNQLDVMLTTLNQVYGDNWDMYTYDGKLQIVIRFKNIEISNTQGAKHDIKELYVKLQLQLHKNVTISSYTGTRAQRDLTEEVCSYSHSHLSRYTKLGEFGDFCYTSTEVYDLRAMFNSKFDVDVFDLLLQTIDTYVRHESLEGVPHMYIKDLSYNSGTNSRSLNTLPNLLLNNYVQFFKEIGNEEHPIKYRILENNYIEVEDKYLREELKRIFVEQIEDINVSVVSEVLVKKNLRERYTASVNLNRIALHPYSERHYYDSSEYSLEEGVRRKPTNNELKKEGPSFLFRGEKINITNYTTKEHKNFKENEQSKEKFIQEGEIRECIYTKVKDSIEQKLNKERFIERSTF